MAPSVLKSALEGKQSIQIQTDLGLTREILDAIIKYTFHFQSYSDLTNNIKVELIYDALLKNPSDYKDFLQDSEISKFYSSRRGIEKFLIKTWIRDINNPYIEKDGWFKMVKVAAVAPILLDLYREGLTPKDIMDKNNLVMAESRLRDFFSSEQEVIEYTKIILNIKSGNIGGSANYLRMLNDLNYLGDDFQQRTGINSFYFVY